MLAAANLPDGARFVFGMHSPPPRPRCNVVEGFSQIRKYYVPWRGIITVLARAKVRTSVGAAAALRVVEAAALEVVAAVPAHEIIVAMPQ